ncbi:MAG TPA: periplasmic heavy metal sensor [Thermomicrobiales bacterium]|nr:periplasmic heavy metal sensor [Thermomicrobiales bacterium]
MKARQYACLLAFALAWGVGFPAPAAAAEPARECGGLSVMLDQQGQRSGDERRQGQNRRQWWTDPTDRAELGISAQQSAKIDEIFKSHIGAQRERWAESRKLEPLVDKLIKEGTADPSYVGQQVQQLESLKADMNAARIVMLYRVMRELSPEQREKLKRLQERREAEHRKSTDSQNRR